MWNSSAELRQLQQALVSPKETKDEDEERRLVALREGDECDGGGMTLYNACAVPCKQRPDCLKMCL